MLIISKNYPCNTIGFLYNKGNKLPSIKIECKKVANTYNDIGIVILKPIIDKITFGFTPTQEFINRYDPSISVREYKKYIKTSLFADAKYAESTNNFIEGVSLVTGVSFKKPPYKNYNMNLRYKPKSSSKSIFIQIAPKDPKSNLAFMRFDMNPSHFNAAAMTEFKAFLEGLLVMPGGIVPYDDVLASSKIYRADVAVDILGARPYDLEIKSMSNNKESPKKSHIYKSDTGRKETVYPKLKKGKSSGEYIYDKRKEQLDKREEPIYGEFLHTRYECRIQKTDFHNLAKLTNRCSRVSIHVLDPRKFSKAGHVQQLFVRHVLDRTLENAIEIIPDKLKSKFEKSYNDVMCNIWDAKSLWGHWKKTVETSGFFPAKK